MLDMDIMVTERMKFGFKFRNRTVLFYGYEYLKQQNFEEGTDWSSRNAGEKLSLSAAQYPIRVQFSTASPWKP
jgi:hypothetical protein